LSTISAFVTSTIGAVKKISNKVSHTFINLFIGHPYDEIQASPSHCPAAVIFYIRSSNDVGGIESAIAERSISCGRTGILAFQTRTAALEALDGPAAVIYALANNGNSFKDVEYRGNDPEVKRVLAAIRNRSSSGTLPPLENILAVPYIVEEIRYGT
jgi:hypothetical protein